MCDHLSYGTGGRCEKRGWDKCNILFGLINIPTSGAGSSQKSGRVVVKKWDKEDGSTAEGEVYPKGAFARVSFSKKQWMDM
jgi:hypothetical protein